MDENSGSSQAAIPNDGDYIVAIQYDASGNKTGEIWYQTATLSEVIAESNEEAVVDALATIQNDQGVFEVDTAGNEVIYTCCVVIIAALFMCLGAISVRTLLRSFER